MLHSSNVLAVCLAGISYLVPLAIPAYSQDPEQYLRDQYQNKALVLRGFYFGKSLSYDFSGVPTGGALPGDWTSDAVVVLKELKISDRYLSIKAERQIVGMDGEFHLVTKKQKHNNKKSNELKIEAELEQNNPSPAQVDAMMSRIFLTSHDDFVDLVPDYWKPCIRGGLTGGNPSCHFSSELLAIPGIAISKKSMPTNEKRLSPEAIVASRIPPSPRGPLVRPPRPIHQPEPAFTDAARQAHFQGAVTLGLIVNNKGIPTDLKILKPLGCGLDAQAVHTVETWTFEPAVKDGKPVAAQIAVVVDFRYY